MVSGLGGGILRVLETESYGRVRGQWSVLARICEVLTGLYATRHADVVLDEVSSKVAIVFCCRVSMWEVC